MVVGLYVALSFCHFGGRSDLLSSDDFARCAGLKCFFSFEEMLLRSHSV